MGDRYGELVGTKLLGERIGWNTKSVEAGLCLLYDGLGYVFCLFVARSIAVHCGISLPGC